MTHLVFEQNPQGRDFFISDIFGHKRKFERALARVGFNADAGDRLFCVGDLVDRGEDNLEILGKQLHWNSFHSIIGNHEVMLMEAFENNQQDQDFDIYSFGRSSTAHAANGGKWFSMLRPATREQAVWGRAVLQDFLAGRDVAPVNGIDAVVHGHTLVTQPI
ncbi:hypothetical protein THIAE_05840 [Thiomicrospira aerophila AL3]|uniref:Calcineurin-like phosphoesterase domain-containing protein n=1 Tax=Thiomicrospira aerophila AL3 TaxID=717772 RepID=W0DYD1_9GAMM|nr:metallophosphoesterase [Thiomicrospira aerophila]AHF02263.1 hypothetical protein THIAE_05840 [Thiomicrospira aerophila AL3]